MKEHLRTMLTDLDQDARRRHRTPARHQTGGDKSVVTRRLDDALAL